MIIMTIYPREVINLRTTARSHFTPALCSSKTLRKSNTKFQFKTVYFLGVRGLASLSYIVCDYTTSRNTDLSVSVLCAIKCWRLISSFCMVHSNRTVAVLLHKHFSSWPAHSLSLSASSWIVCMLLWASLTLQHMSTIHYLFQVSLLCLISLQYCLSFTGFSLGLH
jgi:hypothetical protein